MERIYDSPNNPGRRIMELQSPKTRHEELELSFERFNNENPQLYEVFKKEVFTLMGNGRSRLSSGMILMLIRSDPTIRDSSGDKLRLNQNYSAFFAKKFLSDYPQHSKVFKVQKQPTKDRSPLKTKLVRKSSKGSRNTRSQQRSSRSSKVEAR